MIMMSRSGGFIAKLVMFGALYWLVADIIEGDNMRRTIGRRTITVEGAELDLDSYGHQLGRFSRSIDERELLATPEYNATTGPKMARSAAVQPAHSPETKAAKEEASDSDDDSDDEYDEDDDDDDDDDGNEQAKEAKQAKKDAEGQQQAKQQQQQQQQQQKQKQEQEQQKPKQKQQQQEQKQVTGAEQSQTTVKPDDALDIPRVIKGWGIGAGGLKLG